MLDIKFIRQNPEKVKEGCSKKKIKCDINRLLAIDGQRREFQASIEELRAKQNKMSGQKKPEKKEIEELKKIKNEIKAKEEELEKTGGEFETLMRQVPNLPLDDVIEGESDADNKVLREMGEKPEFDFEPKEYTEIAEALGIIDTERAARASGSRFGYIKGGAALLEFALVKLALETAMEKGFKPVVPPVMLGDKAMRGMGYLDRGEDEVYHLEKDNLYLVGTSEQSIGAMHMDEILEEDSLPLRYIGFSTCFRREAGSYGKDTKGILRVHQFDKMEMFSFCKPENSEEEHKMFLEIEESLMQALKIPYRVIDICAADLGDPAAKKWDIEAWMPGQNQYRETHSTSNCTDWQARRLNIRYRASDGVKFVYTLNGTAFSMRPLIAILENCQRKDGKIDVPKVLQKYAGFKIID